MMRFVWRKFSCSKEVQEVIGEAEEQSVDKIIEGYIATWRLFLILHVILFHKQPF